MACNFCSLSQSLLSLNLPLNILQVIFLDQSAPSKVISFNYFLEYHLQAIKKRIQLLFLILTYQIFVDNVRGWNHVRFSSYYTWFIEVDSLVLIKPALRLIILSKRKSI